MVNTWPPGTVTIDFADKALGDGLEKKLIAWLCTTGVEVLQPRQQPRLGKSGAVMHIRCSRNHVGAE
jgi:hypothetical protein